MLLRHYIAMDHIESVKETGNSQRCFYDLLSTILLVSPYLASGDEHPCAEQKTKKKDL